MSKETTRRGFLHDGTLATAGVLATVPNSASLGSEQPGGPNDPQAFPRFHPAGAGRSAALRTAASYPRFPRRACRRYPS